MAPHSDASWILIGIAAVLAIAGLVQLLRWYRQRRQRAALIGAITARGFEHRHNVLIPDGQGGNLHIDFLLLTVRGVVVIDLRDVAGNIFGGDQMTEWTVMHHARRYTFANPQTALYDRIAAVRALADDVPVEGRILFTRRGRFPKGLPRYTLLLESLAAEFPPADRQAMSGLLERWLPAWQRIGAALRPSPLERPRPAV
ncbi:MAG: NERD domain-containing protein [Gammaproteobacteria bacterium]|nr:NERD domain-containing protein [Gammaproteobacteria bacterium]